MTDEQKIEACVQTYIDSMERSDPGLVKRAFHPNGIVVGYLHGDFMEMSTEDFANFVAAQQPPPKDKGEDVIFELLSCEIEGTTALAKVRDKYLGITFLDTLSFIKVDDRWQLYTKLFNVESE